MASIDDVSTLQESLTAWCATQEQLKTSSSSLNMRLETLYNDLDDVASKLAQQRKTFGQMQAMMREVQRSVADDDDAVVDASGATAAQQPSDTALQVRECETVMLLGEASLKELQSVAVPNTRSTLIRFLLGRVNAKLWKAGDRLQLKNEYNKFKWRTTFLFILFPLLQLYLRAWESTDSSPLFALHHAWLCYCR
jgi:hypothetical protein